MKDYISITKENADRILALDKWETGVIIWILMTADESGTTTERKALEVLRISRKQAEKALAGLEAKGFINRDGATITVLGWDQYQL